MSNDLEAKRERRVGVLCYRSLTEMSKEFNLNTWMLGTGYEYRNFNLFSNFKPFIILPINLPKKPNVATLASELNVELRYLKHWDQAAYNASQLSDNDLTEPHLF